MSEDSNNIIMRSLHQIISAYSVGGHVSKAWSRRNFMPKLR